MNAFEYSTGLFAIVIGLAIADLGNSLHKLLRADARWSFRAGATALVVATVVSGMWFQQWTLRNRTDVLTYPFYFSLVVELVLAYLVAAATLPDEVAPRYDLRAFYEANARRIWTLFLLFQLSFSGHWIYFWMTRAEFSAERFAAVLPIRLTWLIVPALLAVFPRALWMHRLLIPALTVLYVSQLWRMTLG